MADYTYSDDFTTPGTSAEVDLKLELTLTQNQELNRSSLAWVFKMVKGSAGFPYRAGNDCVAAASINGLVYSASNLNYDLPAGPQTLVIASGTRNVTHNADGTKTITVSGSYDGKSPLGVASIPGTSLVLPKIDRNIVRVGEDDSWVLAELYAGVDGDWVPALPHAGVDDVWKGLTT